MQDLINLCKNDTGKVFVVDEKGDMKLVILGVGEYQRLLLGKLKQQVADIEAINREILRAQLEDSPSAAAPISINNNSQSNGSRPSKRTPTDLRSEVVDPNFNFKRTAEDDSEAIRPQFDDI